MMHETMIHESYNYTTLFELYTVEFINDDHKYYCVTTQIGIKYVLFVMFAYGYMSKKPIVFERYLFVLIK